MHPFKNKKVRQALSQAIDRVAIAQQIGSLHEIPAYRILPPLLRKDFGEEVSHDFKSKGEDLFSLLQKGLIEENLQLETLLPITLIYESTDQFRRIALALQEQWKLLLGVPIQLHECDQASLFDFIAKGKFSICLTYMAAQCNDPIYILDRFKFKKMKKNIPGFENQKYIEQLDIANQTADPLIRNLALLRAEKILFSEAPVAPIYYINQGVLLKPTFTHFACSPIGNILFKYMQPVSSDESPN